MKTLIFFLCTLSGTCNLHAQNIQTLTLSLQGEDSTATKMIETIGYQNQFSQIIAMKKEIDSLHQKLQLQGYIDATRQPLQKTSDSTYSCNFTLRKLYKNILINYSDTAIPPETILQISTQHTDSTATIPFSKLENTLKLLTNTIVAKGNTFSHLQLTSIQKRDTIVTAQLKSVISKTRTIDKFIIKNYTKFPRSFLKYYARLRPNTTFNKETVLEKSERLEQLNFVSNIKPPEILFNKDTTTVYLYLQKQSANTFEGFLGFSNDATTNKLTFNGNVTLELINNLHYGEQVSIRFKSDGNNQQRFRGNLQLPYLFKSPLGVEAGIDIFKKDSSFLITQQQLRLNYLVNSTTQIGAGYETQKSNNLLTLPPPSSTINDYTANFINLSFSYRKSQNHPLFPLKSKYSLLTAFGNRKTDLENIQQTKGQLTLTHLFNILHRNSIYLNSDTAAILSDNLFINELFRFGGINSIRGFEENSLNASLYTVLNTEYRYLLSSNLYIHSIFDYAYFEDESNNISDTLNSFGFGIGLLTQTGLFRIIFANGKNSAQNFAFSNTKVHLSLTARF